MTSLRTLVVVGGGFAGTTLARRLDRRLPPGWRLLLISEESYTTFNPMLPGALGASIFPEQVVAPIRAMLEKGRFVMGRLDWVKPDEKRLGVTTLAGSLAFDYDHLVFAVGNRARLDIVEGCAEHAVPLETVGDAMHIRNLVLRRVAQIELESDPATRGVGIRCGARAVRVSEGSVELKGGEMLATSTVICTIGTQPNPAVEALDVPKDRGRIVVGPDLSAPGQQGLWAIGDCAVIVNAHDGQPAPPTAQFAVREGRCLADNLLATIEGNPTRPFAYRSRGSLAAIGQRKGVADVFGLPLSGLPAWLLWRAYYLSQMPTLGRKVRIFVEWTWGRFFPNDITHLRFHRSADLQEGARDGSAV